MSVPYTSARLENLKAELVAAIPCLPDHRDTLSRKTLGEVLRHYLTWKSRLIPPRPRSVVFTPGFWDILVPDAILVGVGKLKRLFEEGSDLQAYLSCHVETHGYGAERKGRSKGFDWVDRETGPNDFALNVLGLHQLHFKPHKNCKRDGPSAELLFVNVDLDHVQFVMIGDHKSFDSERLRQKAAVARSLNGLVLPGVGPSKELSPVVASRMLRRGINVTRTVDGQTVPTGPVMLSGGAMATLMKADMALDFLERWDPALDTAQGRKAFASTWGIPSDLTGAQWSYDPGSLCLIATSGTAYRFPTRPE